MDNNVTAVQKEKIKPKLFSVMKNYTKQQFVKDLVSGVIVAIIALPLSIALALASGVNPEQGLYTAIAAGFVVSFLGGSRVQIAGPTAAFATIVAGIVAEKGMNGLTIATIMAGIMLVIMGFCRLGTLIKFIPSTITTGFTFGIAVTIIVGQLKDFMGLTFNKSPIETTEKLKQVFECISTFNLQAFLIGLLGLAILIFWPKKLQKIPASLIAVVVCSLVVNLADLNVNTIGDLYQISSSAPKFSFPSISFTQIRDLVPDAVTIAVLAAIESLLSCVVADGMIGSKHRSNMELIAQGGGNIASALFGGIPATGAIARTAANIKNGGRTPIAGMVHSVVVLLILLILMPYAKLIPMPAIAAVLFQVAYNMSGWRTIVNTVKTAPKSDVAVLFVTLILTVVFDLVVAIVAGLDDQEEENDVDNIELKKVPDNTKVFEINGPMFFAVSDKFMSVVLDTSIDVLVIRMRNVPAIDATGIETLKKIIQKCERHNIDVVFSHVNEQPKKAMKKAGFAKLVGKENFCNHIDTALVRAEEIENIKKQERELVKAN